MVQVNGDEAIRDNHLEMPILEAGAWHLLTQHNLLQASLLNVLITNLQHIFC